MATAVKGGYHGSRSYDHLSDAHVMAYCLLLFFICLLLTVFSGMDSRSMILPYEMQDGTQVTPSKVPLDVPIPDEQSPSSLKLSV